MAEVKREQARDEISVLKTSQKIKSVQRIAQSYPGSKNFSKFAANRTTLRRRFKAAPDKTITKELDKGWDSRFGASVRGNGWDPLPGGRLTYDFLQQDVKLPNIDASSPAPSNYAPGYFIRKKVKEMSKPKKRKSESQKAKEKAARKETQTRLYKAPGGLSADDFENYKKFKLRQMEKELKIKQERSERKARALRG